jgi:hypothetical protein
VNCETRVQVHCTAELGPATSANVAVIAKKSHLEDRSGHFSNVMCNFCVLSYQPNGTVLCLHRLTAFLNFSHLNIFERTSSFRVQELLLH